MHCIEGVEGTRAKYFLGWRERERERANTQVGAATPTHKPVSTSGFVFGLPFVLMSLSRHRS